MKAVLWDESKTFLSLSFDISLSVFVRHTCHTRMISISDLFYPSISVSLYPVYKRDKDGVSHGVRVQTVFY